MNGRDYIIIGLVLLIVLACGIMLYQRSTIGKLRSTLVLKVLDYEQMERNYNQHKELVQKLIKDVSNKDRKTIKDVSDREVRQ